MQLDNADQLAGLFLVLSDSARLDLLLSLDSDEKSVAHLNSTLWLGEAEIERHMRTLSTWEMVIGRQEDGETYYRLNTGVCEVTSESVYIRMGGNRFAFNRPAAQELQF